MLLLFPKVGGEFRGIGVVQIFWKALLGVINHQIGVSVKFYDMFHGFWLLQGIGTAYLKVKLLRHLVSMSKEVLYKVFLDLRMAYYYLDREWCLDILVGYGIVPRT